MTKTGDYVPMVLHVDGDNFFVSCEVARMAHLYGKPVVVGAERGIATALNVQAKKLGISRGMPVFKIKKEFPQVAILPAHFELYEKYSDNLFSILTNYQDHVKESASNITIDCIQRYSIDECFGVVYVHKSKINDIAFLEDFLLRLKQKVNTSLGVTYSFGLAPTKTLAKVASKLNKPNGHAAIIHNLDAIKEILKGIPVKDIWGIGWALSTRYTKMNIKTAYDFIMFDPNYLIKHFATPCYDTWAELRGIVRLATNNKHEDYKSMQSTQCFTKTSDVSYVASEVSRHSEIIASRMRMRNYCGDHFGISIKFNYKGSNFQKSDRFTTPSLTNNPYIIIEAAHKALQGLLNQLPPGALVKATGLGAHIVKEADIRMDLFGARKLEQDINDQAKIIDVINHKFGSHTIMNASSLNSFTSRDDNSTRINVTNGYEYGLPLTYLGEAY